MKERPQVLMQILKGKGLSDEQIQAVLKILET
jgi:SOS response regulatory protein OraA/RecX